MYRLLKKYFDSDFDSEILKEKFDYNFDENSNNDFFELEYKKFMWINSCFFYSNGALRTSINSYYVCINLNDLEHIFKLYRYAFNNDYKEKYILGEFLLTYYNSINSKDYKNNGSGKELIKEYKKIEKKYELNNSLYSELINISQSFYDKLINFVIKNDKLLYDNVIERIKNNIKDSNIFNRWISQLMKIEDSLWILIDYDNEIKEHVDNYNKYIEKEINDYNVYKYPSKIIFKLDNKKLLDSYISDLFINDIVDKINDMYDKLLSKKVEIIGDVAFIDNLLEQINNFINLLKTISNEQRNKLKECRNNLMTIKRYVLSDDEMIKNSLHEFKYDLDIKKSDIEKIVSSITNNVYTLYSNSKVDFEREMENALKSYANHPLLDITNGFTLDSIHQTYYKYNKVAISNFFSDYYNELGKKYTINNQNKLMNCLSGGYYDQLLKHLRRTFLFKQSLMCNFLMQYGKFEEIIEKLKKELRININNYYSLVAHNVIEIEVRIVDILKSKKIKIGNSQENIENLAKYYKNNKTAFNGLMYINYILYEESGLKIRNNILHGNLIGQELYIELIVTFSSIILLQWLYNEK